ncbi:Protein AF-9 homolog [Taphrina deformans PYCC 5710]|uniref:Protein AF-9 homolog n=1 Tax=Taphrina deformans (strain PYCC 5710 / ATCC 11124 / CBS 356.35 / IMI 108563 / JCM 9778 / NBRC 8474) TaxID=1097556 RepID=R4X810_TAPDE|nr:Protein AF-9 homolog [Taphrina deformans PYCC 5710]|eukprot:CCG81387.1 Protein AF-9 homolog [Taphrina deformans PYCC 5710]
MAPARVPRCAIFRPIVIGNDADLLGGRKDPASDHTHEWTVSVRGVNDADISHFVKKVNFKLHDSYANSTRSIEAPPFQVTETGWGEFDVQVKIFFVQEAAEKPVTVYHRLKLHPYGPDAEKVKAEGGHVSSYQYDEVVFNEPTEAMYEILTTNGEAQLPVERSAGKVYCQRSEQEELERLETAIAKIDEQTRRYKEKIMAMEKR